MSNKIKGKYGEEIAVNYLIKNGCKIVEKITVFQDMEKLILSR